MGYVWNLIVQQGTLVLSVPNPTKIGVLKLWSAYPWHVQGHTRLFYLCTVNWKENLVLNICNISQNLFI